MQMREGEGEEGVESGKGLAVMGKWLKGGHIGGVGPRPRAKDTTDHSRTTALPCHSSTLHSTSIITEHTSAVISPSANRSRSLTVNSFFRASTPIQRSHRPTLASTCSTALERSICQLKYPCDSPRAMQKDTSLPGVSHTNSQRQHIRSTPLIPPRNALHERTLPPYPWLSPGSPGQTPEKRVGRPATCDVVQLTSLPSRQQRYPFPRKKRLRVGIWSVGQRSNIQRSSPAPRGLPS